MKICVLGAGALGCAIGGVLTEAGHEVWLINRNAAQVEAMNSRGLILRDGGVDRKNSEKRRNETPEKAKASINLSKQKRLRVQGCRIGLRL